MTWLRHTTVSLLDTAGKWPTEWWLVYGETDVEYWWNRWLKPGFRHVHAIKRVGDIWIEYRPEVSFTEVGVVISDLTPWQLNEECTLQRVRALREDGPLRMPFFMGPLTCVESIKALLGIRDFWIRTPFQLFNHCRRLAPCNDRRHRSPPLRK